MTPLPIPHTARADLLRLTRAAAAARTAEAAAKAALDARRAAFDLETAGLRDRLEQARRSREGAEASLRDAALLVIKASGDKRPAPGIGARDTTQVEILDRAAALVWARSSGLCLALDEAALVAVAKTESGRTLPFLRVTTEPQVTLAKDLAAALAAADLMAPTAEAPAR